jgi:hypothetical protein
MKFVTYVLPAKYVWEYQIKEDQLGGLCGALEMEPMNSFRCRWLWIHWDKSNPNFHPRPTASSWESTRGDIVVLRRKIRFLVREKYFVLQINKTFSAGCVAHVGEEGSTFKDFIG